MAWYKKLHWQILIGLALGLIYGLVAARMQWTQFTSNWIAPFGTIFINLLKFIGAPLVLVSLVTGVASLSDTKKLTRMGGKTILIYVCTTSVAVTLGLVIANTMNPGAKVPDTIQNELKAQYQADIEERKAAAKSAKDRGPLQPIVDVVPENFFNAISDNRNMLQIVFVAFLMGVALIQVPEQHSQPVLAVFKGLYEMIIRIVHLIMVIAPIGVFALLADVITGVAADHRSKLFELLGALGFYCMAVVSGLLIQALVVYPILLRWFTPISFKRFFKAIGPAQAVAFSTSSSGATLPVTMERCEENLGVSEEVSSFVLPLGATINMDGTALYQAVAAVFIAGATGIHLDLTAQITIVLTAVMASIGTAAVPAAGIIMLVIILEAIQVPSEGIALILGVDRILDMLRTTCNITGDAAVASVVASTENQLSDPDQKD